jgi:hypothetical protein
MDMERIEVCILTKPLTRAVSGVPICLTVVEPCRDTSALCEGHRQLRRGSPGALPRRSYGSLHGVIETSQNRPLMTRRQPSQRRLGKVSHVCSPNNPETAACDTVCATYVAAGQPHWALRDGEVLLVDGEKVDLLPA